MFSEDFNFKSTEPTTFRGKERCGVTPELLEKWHFVHYAGTPVMVFMREIYSGMYISWDWEDNLFRLMPDFKRGFPGIVLPHRTMGQVVAMVSAMGGDWCK